MVMLLRYSVFIGIKIKSATIRTYNHNTLVDKMLTVSFAKVVFSFLSVFDMPVNTVMQLRPNHILPLNADRLVLLFQP